MSVTSQLEPALAKQPTAQSQNSIVEASISQLQQALDSGQTNAVELVAQHLHRIAQYDRRGICINAIPVLNLDVFEEATASDDRRANGSLPVGSLEGIPYTVKDSYKVRGMTMAAGSPAFKSLIADQDAFTISKIKQAGGIILGRTNMPPMACGGMQRGIYGRAESPYSKDYLTAAFASGSSNGSASATAASFGVFGMGEETVSSGRSPASNNALVAYTPSRGLISVRGNWPLYPTCDVIVPHTRTLEDMFTLLDVIVGDDDVREGDFWRQQPFVKLPSASSVRPSSFHDLSDTTALVGKHIGIPKMYIGADDAGGRPVHTRQSVIDLWKKARVVLEYLGATVTEVDFPVIARFESPSSDRSDQAAGDPSYNQKFDMRQLMSYSWDDFLVNNKGANCSTLADIIPGQIFPRPPGALKDRYPVDAPLADPDDVVARVSNGRVSIFDIPDLDKQLQALEDQRKTDFEDWMDERKLDCVVWPSAGDVGREDADSNEESARHAWLNGVHYSNGNRAIRQLGIPTVNIPMGFMHDTNMPVNLSFASKAYDDNNLFRYAFAYECASKARQPPPRTPPLGSDIIGTDTKNTKSDHVDKRASPKLTAQGMSSFSSDCWDLLLTGAFDATECGGLRTLHVYVDGRQIDHVALKGERWEATAKVERPGMELPREKASPDREKTMVVILASGKNGRSTGKLLFI